MPSSLTEWVSLRLHSYSLPNLKNIRCLPPEHILNTARLHQGLDQQIPVPKMTHGNTGPVRCRAVLGGIIHDYYRDAA
jgi:hypothetical protein